ncbi:carbohydrate kinase family protein [Brevibacillus choshinensis]|uniref:carbohydrate kinase family protein n=1 Tax=Brevibacillus choshinensis TaxID=54911 RepID=UPI002E1FEF01|nr:carbohydrate kinase family protein [Brevibacillus choshinensis]MED4750699.1 carbohydrate kinase family protein [Brevibacillus choshinensis]MED4779798.1 carbohydrate kinase family protein [Brevibacillus choshinensis]
MDRNYSFFVGDIALDEYYRAPYWPNIREKVLVETLEKHVGGMIANAASVYNAYNESVYFLSLLNSGNITQMLCEDLRKRGIDTRYILTDDTLPDAKNIIILTEDDHTLFIPTLGIKHFEITPEIIEDMCKAKYVYSSIVEVRPLRCGEMDAMDIIKKIRASGAKIVYDLDVAHLEPGDERFFEEMDIVFFNKNGFDVYRNGAPYEQAVAQLLNKGTEMVVVTFAEEGCKVHTKDQLIEVPGISVEVVDVTGAGDTFCSSFIHALNQSEDLRLVANFANAAAARAVTIMGPRGGVASSETIISFLIEKGIGTEEEYIGF